VFLVKRIIMIMCVKIIKVNLHLLKLFKKKFRLFSPDTVYKTLLV